MYRHFLYLDSQDVLNALSCFDDDISERTIKTIRSADFGGRISIGPIEVGGKSNRAIEEEVRRKTTSYSAISSLLQRLEKQIGRIDKDRMTFEENRLIQFDGDIELWPAEQLPAHIQRSTWSALRARFWPTEGDQRRSRQLALSLPDGATFKATVGPTGRTAVMHLRADYLQVSKPKGGLRREVTVIGQVESWSEKPKDGREGPAPQLALSRRAEALAVVRDVHGSGETNGWTPELVPISEVDASESPPKLSRPFVESLVMEQPWVLLRPLCIFKGSS